LHNVQALRGVAALIVVFAHVSGPGDFEDHIFGARWVGWANLPANTGVDLFFVISGLIMVITTWRSYDARGSALRFLWRRVTRIYPLYWVVTTALLALAFVSPGSVRFDDEAHASLLNSYLLIPSVGRFPVLVAWTLVYEMYFYLMFTLAMLLRRRRFGWLVGSWAIVTVGLHMLVGDTTNPFLRVISSPLNLEFALGIVIGYAVIRGWVFRPWVCFITGVVAAIGGLALLGASGWTEFPSDSVRLVGPGVVAAVLVYGAIGIELVRGVRLPALVQHTGDASYSLYLIHVPALTALGAVLAKVVPPTPVWHAIVLFLVPVYVVAVALMSYHVVERPLQTFFRGLLGRWDARMLARSSPSRSTASTQAVARLPEG
jgi:peptidoglycan/LPS O-acetylase OafA/YrhL